MLRPLLVFYAALAILMVPVAHSGEQNRSPNSRDQFENCGSNKVLERVQSSHNRAVEFTEKADRILLSSARTVEEEDLLKKGLRIYFKLDPLVPEDNKCIQKVFAMVHRLSEHGNKTRYLCHFERKGPWCTLPSAAALVPPPKNVVHLCPNFLRLGERDDQATILIHEWGHRWGGNLIQYLPEIYCGVEKKSKAKSLIRQSDEYAFFIYFLATGGEEQSCF